MRDEDVGCGVLMGDRLALKSRLVLVLGLVGVELRSLDLAGLPATATCFTGVESPGTLQLK